MVKLLLTDVDGTVVREGGSELNPQYYEVIQGLKEEGVTFGVASGRQYASVAHLFEPLKEDLLIICNNGTYATRGGKDIFVDKMAWEDVHGIIGDVRKIPSCIVMYDTVDVTYIESGNPGFHRLLRDDYHYDFRQVPDLTKVEKECTKLSLYCPENMENIMSKAFIPKWKDRIKASFSGECFLDCMRTGSNKGRALSVIQELYGIDRSETMVFGDNINDIEMLSQADFSYAMGNAREEVRQAAQYTAAPYWEDGVLQEMKRVLRFLREKRKM